MKHLFILYLWLSYFCQFSSEPKFAAHFLFSRLCYPASLFFFIPSGLPSIVKIEKLCVTCDTVRSIFGKILLRIETTIATLLMLGFYILVCADFIIGDNVINLFSDYCDHFCKFSCLYSWNFSDKKCRCQGQIQELSLEGALHFPFSILPCPTSCKWIDACC